jgi:serine/threonine protein kinase
VEVEKGQVYVVTPLMDWDLDVMIRKKGVRLSATEVCNFLVQMLLGLLHLHSGHVIHRDLKPANIFVRKDGLVKIGDLGLSRGIDLEDESGEPLRTADEALTEYVVTRWYRAPEVILLPAEYGPPVDVWSVGCILYEMVTGKVLFQGRSSFDQLRRIVAILGTPKGKAADWLRQAGAAKRMLQQLPDSPPRLQKLREDWHIKMSDVVKKLLEEMLAFDPDARPSIEDALEKPCFADALKDRGVAEAKLVPIFPQEYDKEFDALDRASERRLLPKVARMLQAEISDYRGEDPSTRRRTVTPPRSSVSASSAARRTPPRTSASESRKVTRASSGPRLSVVPDADSRTEPRAISSDPRREPRASSGPRVSTHDVDIKKDVRRLTVPDGESRRETRTSTSQQRLGIPDGETRVLARSTSAQRPSHAGQANPASARSSRTGVTSRENHSSDRAPDPVDEHPMIDMAVASCI